MKVTRLGFQGMARVLGITVVVASLVTGCGPADSFDEETGLSPDLDATSVERDPLLRMTGASAYWKYQGRLPNLMDPSITISQRGHTVRVSGYLPEGWTGLLPFHAVPSVDSSGRRRVHVVYPIATANEALFNDNGSPVRNIEPGVYPSQDDYQPRLLATLYTPTDSNAPWGGFPYIEYVHRHRESDGRVRSGIAMHGPITAFSHEGTRYWELLRGPVSHGCNRMLGEHVVELAHLIGFDMTRASQTGVMVPVPGDTKVRVLGGFDRWHGRLVDVDYPSYRWLRPAASRSIVFPTWQSVRNDEKGVLRVEFPRWVCEASRCKDMPASTKDELTGGLELGALKCPVGKTLLPVGRRGGRICATETHGYAPFTSAMRKHCGTSSMCRLGTRWPLDVALAARGAQACPRGSQFDALTRYCTEGAEALGPFPTALVAECKLKVPADAAACDSNRWNRIKLARVLGKL